MQPTNLLSEYSKVAYYSFFRGFFWSIHPRKHARDIVATRGKYHASVEREPNRNNKPGARKKKFFSCPLNVHGLPVSCPFNFPNGNLKQQWSHIGVFICYPNI